MDGGETMGLDDQYAAAVKRLREVGAGAVADRFKSANCGFDLDRTPMAQAVMCAVDSVDAERAARLDPVNRDRWLAISADQRLRSTGALNAVLRRVRA